MRFQSITVVSTILMMAFSAMAAPVSVPAMDQTLDKRADPETEAASAPAPAPPSNPLSGLLSIELTKVLSKDSGIEAHNVNGDITNSPPAGEGEAAPESAGSGSEAKSLLSGLL
ncbi:hypothetical protein BJ944DRAFT_264664 [Cunninghamella echinulata]|nr:hypothetical protein BJ944DRAFT_264664 [Cunninghamella echinulata]